MIFSEPFIEQRAKKAREKARKIFRGEVSDEDDIALMLQWYIAKHYGIPIFDSYFRKRTLDDLFFEAELIRMLSLPPEAKNAEVVKEHKEEADRLFDDWDDEESDFQDVPSGVNEAAIDEATKRFFETNKFTTEE